MPRTLSKPGPPTGPYIGDLSAMGNLVRNRRLELALRIDDTAHACCVSANVLSRLENGGAIGTDRLLWVLQGLGLSILIMPTDDAYKILNSIGADVPPPP